LDLEKRSHGLGIVHSAEEILCAFNNNNSIPFFIIKVPSQQLQCQLQTQHNVHIGNKIKTNNNNMTNINSIKAN
jgi:hypothetical protein